MRRIAINGFGRMGRAFFRVASECDDIQITHINDIHDFETLAYLLRQDSVFGVFKIHSRAPKIFCDKDKKTLQIDDKIIVLSNSPHPSQSHFDVDIVLDSSGAFLDTATLEHYIKNGAKKVLLSAPPSDDMPIFVVGVNEDSYNNERIISNASCTSNAIAPLMRCILRERDVFGDVESVNITTIHPFNNDQSLLDSSGARILRLNRNATCNLIPIPSSIGRVLGRLFCELKDKAYGDCVRVPTSLVSLSNVDLAFNKKIHRNDILSLKFDENILGFDCDMRVSSDFIGEARSAVIASDLIHINNHTCRIPLWFDNESGYAHRLCDMVRLMCE